MAGLSESRAVCLCGTTCTCSQPPASNLPGSPDRPSSRPRRQRSGLTLSPASRFPSRLPARLHTAHLASSSSPRPLQLLWSLVSRWLARTELWALKPELARRDFSRGALVTPWAFTTSNFHAMKGRLATRPLTCGIRVVLGGALHYGVVLGCVCRRA